MNNRPNLWQDWAVGYQGWQPLGCAVFRGEEQPCFSWWVGSLLKCDRFGYLESTNVIIPHPRGSVEPKVSYSAAFTICSPLSY